MQYIHRGCFIKKFGGSLKRNHDEPHIMTVVVRSDLKFVSFRSDSQCLHDLSLSFEPEILRFIRGQLLNRVDIDYPMQYRVTDARVSCSIFLSDMYLFQLTTVVISACIDCLG